jgi:gliding motility-associated-like protein
VKFLNIDTGVEYIAEILGGAQPMRIWSFKYEIPKNKVSSGRYKAIFYFEIPSSPTCGSTYTVDLGLVLRSDLYFGGFTLALPNAFTPNGDGDNEIFRPIGTGVGYPLVLNSTNAHTIRLKVFNRWGSIVHDKIAFGSPYTPPDVNEVAWDGTVMGVPSPVDTYVYSIETYNCDFPNPIFCAPPGCGHPNSPPIPCECTSSVGEITLLR